MESILSNYLIVVGATAWLSAQLIKLAVAFAAGRGIAWSSLWSSGGMPSSHTALVCSLTVGAAKIYGAGSPIFALALFGGLIVIRDALGVRRQTGEHAKALNAFLHRAPQAPGAEKAFCEQIGHTPLQVLFGALTGLSVGLLIPVY